MERIIVRVYTNPRREFLPLARACGLRLRAAEKIIPIDVFGGIIVRKTLQQGADSRYERSHATPLLLDAPYPWRYPI
jgi:hypothetical protein